MKKIIIACALLVAMAANAQISKEEKAAIKEAKSLVKKAESIFKSSVKNEQSGRKETNFEKMDEARSLINSSLTNQYVKDDALTWKVAADIEFQYYQKYDNLAKIDESNKPQLLEIAGNVAEYCIKYDSLNTIQAKKAEDAKKEHEYYQKMAANPLLVCLQASQGLSSSKNPDDLKLAVKYSLLAKRGLGESNLMSDFNNPQKNDWIAYAKGFYAQALSNSPNSSDEQVESAYKELIGTKFEPAAYQTLAQRFKNNNHEKYVEYLKKGFDSISPDQPAYASFAFMLMQDQYNNDKAACLETIQTIKRNLPNHKEIAKAYLMEGQIYFDQKKYKEAEAIFQEAVDKFPEKEEAIIMPAKCAWQNAISSGNKEDMQHAIDMFTDLESKYADKPEYWGESLYILYNNNKEYPKAEKYKKYYKGK